MVTFGSVCSGIEAASVAWEPIGWQPAWFAEIEPFPCSVLAHHWPQVPNLGDMTKLAAMVSAGEIPAPDVLVGGTPCQAFSVAGRRGSLDDERGQLTLAFTRLADEIDNSRKSAGLAECIIVWENVPGVLSTKDNAFGCFLGELSGAGCELQPPGKRWGNAGYIAGPKRTVAWRVLDAQYFGVAQRRRRVFVVASARAGFDPAAVLFEREGVRRDHPPRRGEGENPTGTIAGGARRNGGYSTDDIPLTAGSLRAQAQSSHREDSETFIPVAFGGGANCQQTDVATALSAHPGGTRMDAEIETFIVAGTLQANGKAAGSATQQDAESGLLVVHGTQDSIVGNELAHAMGRNSGQENAVAHICLMPTMVSGGSTDASHNQMSGQFREQYIVPTTAHRVRRLTPVECERLQGFPDNHTAVPHRGKPAADGPRYKAIGNSMAVPVMRWIGQRIGEAINAG